MEYDLDDLNALKKHPCPNCGAKKLRVEFRPAPEGVGTFIFAGTPMTMPVGEWPYLVCDKCKVFARGEVEHGGSAE